MKRACMRIILLCGLIVFLCGCSKPQVVDDLLNQVGLGNGDSDVLNSDGTEVTTGKDYEWIEEHAEECFEEKFSNDFAYERLSDGEKIWYRDINTMLAYHYDGALKLSQEGLDKGLDEDNIEKIYNSVMMDHPEYFFVDGYEYTIYTRSEETVGIEINVKYTYDTEECLERQEEIRKVAEDIIYFAPDDGDDYDKIKYVYETVIYNTDYDMDAEDNQNIYSVFVGNTSVCQGYAKATQYLLNSMGIESTIVYGRVRGGELHSWNLVKSGGDYYHLDTTWGDASYTADEEEVDLGDVPEINYDYLCVTTKQIATTHDIVEVVELPVCKAQTDNYYIREGNYFYEFDEEQLENEFMEAVESGTDTVALKCDNEEVYHEFYTELVENQGVFDYLYDDYEKVAFAENEDQLTLTFWMTK